MEIGDYAGCYPSCGVEHMQEDINTLYLLAVSFVNELFFI